MSVRALASVDIAATRSIASEVVLASAAIRGQARASAATFDVPDLVRSMSSFIQVVDVFVESAKASHSALGETVILGGLHNNTVLSGPVDIVAPGLDSTPQLVVFNKFTGAVSKIVNGSWSDYPPMPTALAYQSDWAGGREIPIVMFPFLGALHVFWLSSANLLVHAQFDYSERAWLDSEARRLTEDLVTQAVGFRRIYHASRMGLDPSLPGSASGIALGASQAAAVVFPEFSSSKRLRIQLEFKASAADGWQGLGFSASKDDANEPAHWIKLHGSDTLPGTLAAETYTGAGDWQSFDVTVEVPAGSWIVTSNSGTGAAEFRGLRVQHLDATSRWFDSVRYVDGVVEWRLGGYVSATLRYDGTEVKVDQISNGDFGSPAEALQASQLWTHPTSTTGLEV
jgi:hypothetical protein